MYKVGRRGGKGKNKGKGAIKKGRWTQEKKGEGKERHAHKQMKPERIEKQRKATSSHSNITNKQRHKQTKDASEQTNERTNTQTTRPSACLSRARYEYRSE